MKIVTFSFNLKLHFHPQRQLYLSQFTLKNNGSLKYNGPYHMTTKELTSVAIPRTVFEIVLANFGK